MTKEKCIQVIRQIADEARNPNVDLNWQAAHQMMDQELCVWLHQNGHGDLADAYEQSQNRYPLAVRDSVLRRLGHPGESSHEPWQQYPDLTPRNKSDQTYH